VAAQIGYCGLDRQRLPLRGDEVRACWEAADSGDMTPETISRPMGVGSVWAVGTDADGTAVRSEPFTNRTAATIEGRPWPAPGAPEAARWSLFGEAEL
jgi:hypothetical protein